MEDETGSSLGGLYGAALLVASGNQQNLKGKLLNVKYHRMDVTRTEWSSEPVT